MARRVPIIPIPPVHDDVFPRIELLDFATVAKVAQNRVGSVFGYVKFCRQFDGIASARCRPDPRPAK